MRLGLSQRIPGFGRATDKKKGRAAELCPRDDKDCPGAGRIWMRISCCSTLAAFPPIAMHMRPQGKRRGQPRQFPGWPLWSWLFPVASGPNRGALRTSETADVVDGDKPVALDNKDALTGKTVAWLGLRRNL